MVLSASAKADEITLEEALDLVVAVKNRAVELGKCEHAASPAMKAQLDGALDQLDRAVERGVADGRRLVADLPATAVAAIRRDVAVMCVREQAAAAAAVDIKDTVLALLEALLNAVPVPNGWKIVIRAIIAVVRAIQNQPAQPQSLLV